MQLCVYQYGLWHADGGKRLSLVCGAAGQRDCVYRRFSVCAGIAAGWGRKPGIGGRDSAADEQPPDLLQPQLCQRFSRHGPQDALLDGRGDALSTDNTEVLAWALENPGFTVGIESLGSLDTIAPAVQKGNDTVRAYIDEEIKALAAENFFHADFDATLKDVYGEAVNPDSLVVEDGVTE